MPINLAATPVVEHAHDFDDLPQSQAAPFTFTAPSGSGIGGGTGIPNSQGRWSYARGETPSDGLNVGPPHGQGGTGDGYIFTEMTNTPLLSPGSEFIAEYNTVLDAAAYNWLVSFYECRKWTGSAANATLKLQAWNGTAWVDELSVTGISNAWVKHDVDLSAYTNADLKFRIVVTTGTGDQWRYDTGIDTIRVRGYTPAVTEPTGVPSGIVHETFINTPFGTATTPAEPSSSVVGAVYASAVSTAGGWIEEEMGGAVALVHETFINVPSGTAIASAEPLGSVVGIVQRAVIPSVSGTAHALSTPSANDFYFRTLLVNGGSF